MGMTNEQIVNYLVGELPELIEQREALDINDSFGDYLSGIIERSQTILRMMGIPEELIPNDGSC
jgi:phosphoribosylformylglycinamidine (FGAM) synthase-like amidotransferase family enzyme